MSRHVVEQSVSQDDYSCAIPASVLGDVASVNAATTVTVGIVMNVTAAESSYESTTTFISAVEILVPTDSASDSKCPRSYQRLHRIDLIPSSLVKDTIGGPATPAARSIFGSRAYFRQFLLLSVFSYVLAASRAPPAGPGP